MVASTWSPVTFPTEALSNEGARFLFLSDPARCMATTQEGLVVTTYSGCCDVDLGSEVRLCNLVSAVARTQKTTLAVGDRVLVRLDEQDPRGLVTEVLERRTVLSRPDPHNPDIERVIAANIDVVAIVVALKNPPLRTGLIDRIWIAVQRGGAETILVVNKMDLASRRQLAAADELLEPYRALDIPTFFTSAEDGRGVDELRTYLEGKVVTFAGHSGVGKSSLLNQLIPDVQARTGDVRSRDGRGRHTTTSSTLYRGPAGMIVIDTPGIRSFGVMDSDPAELRWYFPEIIELSASCRFHNCTHVEEPDCAVQEAVDSGELSDLRYDAWLRLTAGDPDVRLKRRGHGSSKRG